ncbi:MAG: hypothetical protein AAGC93_12805 [Cyanobacteria bacterium P01_F01_bin.53]
MSYKTALIDWSSEDYAGFGRSQQLLPHGYHKLPISEKSYLVDLLDNYPRQWLQVFTMGTDPCRREEWQSVDVPTSATGQDIWDAVERGRFWLNIIHITDVSSDFGDLVTGMYEHLADKCPHLVGPKADFSTLLLSSPGTQLYYHLDSSPNMLWNLKGTERFWLYPAMDTRFAPQEFLEKIYAGEIDEEMPYDPEFDKSATCYTLQPGEVASWPHNAPHRVEYIDLSVSLATSYHTPLLERRRRVQLANRYILRNLGIKNRSMKETGVRSWTKRFAYRAINKIRPFERAEDPLESYITDLQLDPQAPNGMRRLSERIPASFSNVN